MVDKRTENLGAAPLCIFADSIARPRRVRGIIIILCMNVVCAQRDFGDLVYNVQRFGQLFPNHLRAWTAY